MEDQLITFLRARNEQGSRPDIDWQSKRDAWVCSVESLYGLIKGMLRESIAANDVKVRESKMPVTEEFIGTYSLPALELTVGQERVEFRPKGVKVVGATGRVDIRGDKPHP